MDAVVDDTFLCRTISVWRNELRWEQRELDWPVGDWYRGGRVQSLRWEQRFWWKFVGSRIGNPLIS
jgi:hypothetical protein